MKNFTIHQATGKIFEGSNMNQAARVCGVSNTYMRKMLRKAIAEGQRSFTIKNGSFQISFNEEVVRDFAAEMASKAIKGKFVDGYLIKDDSMNEYNDCGVRALAWAANVEYKIAHESFRKFANRRNRQGVYNFQIRKAIEGLKAEGTIKGFQGATEIEGFHRMTINQFIEKFPRGRFICQCHGHAFAIINGLVYDNADRTSGRHQIKCAWRIDI